MASISNAEAPTGGWPDEDSDVGEPPYDERAGVVTPEDGGFGAPRVDMDKVRNEALMYGEGYDDDLQTFDDARIQSERINESRTRLVGLYKELDGIDVNKANDFDRFVKKALFNRVVCPLCEQDVTDGDIQVHLESCSRRQTPLTAESSPTAIIVYIQERTREMKLQMKEQADQIKRLNEEIEELKKKGDEADTDRGDKETEIADLKAAVEALEKAKAEIEQKLKECNEALAQARKDIDEAIALHRKEISDLKEEFDRTRRIERGDETENASQLDQLRRRIAQLESELDGLNKAKAEVDAQLAKALRENGELVEKLSEIENALTELEGKYDELRRKYDECNTARIDLEVEQKQLEHDRLTALKAFSAMSNQMSQLLRSLAAEVDSKP